MVTWSMPQSNHIFWVRSKTDCRKASAWTQSAVGCTGSSAADMPSAHCPLHHFWTSPFQFPHSPLQLWWAFQALEKVLFVCLFVFHLMGWFHSVSSPLSPTLEAALICTLFGTGWRLPSSSASCRCPLPRSAALTPQQFLQHDPDLQRGTKPAWKGFFKFCLFCVILQLNQFLHPAHDIGQEEPCYAERWPAKPGGRGHEGGIIHWGQGREERSSNKCQHPHQILLPMKPQFWMKTQNIHPKATFHASSPTALLPARPDHIRAAPCVGSAVFANCSWGYSHPRAPRLHLFCWLNSWPRVC